MTTLKLYIFLYEELTGNYIFFKAKMTAHDLWVGGTCTHYDQSVDWQKQSLKCLE